MVAGGHFKGIAASGGVAIGPAHLLVNRAAVAERRILRGDREAELTRLTAALRAADEQLNGLRSFLAGRSADGLPIGLQIAAPHYAEAELIHFGKLIEQLGLSCPRPDGY